MSETSNGLLNLKSFLNREYSGVKLEGTENADDTRDLVALGDNQSLAEALSGNNAINGNGANDVLSGEAGDDLVSGDAGFDNLYGGSGRDLLGGGDDDDRLFGGSGNDLLFGDEGDDFLDGQGHFNGLSGGPGNDTLVGLGGSAIEDGNALYDNLEGGPGADRFRLRKSNDAEGRLFVEGQKYAIIRDFNPSEEEDKIVLPGTADDYEAKIFGKNNENTAIFYTDNVDVDLGTTFGPISISASTLSVTIPDQTALVAVLDGTTAGNMYNPEFYEYTG